MTSCTGYSLPAACYGLLATSTARSLNSFYTGQRRMQIGALTRSMVNFGAETIAWPAEAMKTGKPHVIPMGRAVRALLEPRDVRQHYNANYRPLVYALADRGLNALRERGVECERTRARRNFAHELMTSELMASIELGARESGVPLITWPDILTSKSLPEKTRHSSKPFHIPITITVEGKKHDTHIAADGAPFGIERLINGRSVYFFCPGIEADCGTEPVDTSDIARSSIFK